MLQLSSSTFRRAAKIQEEIEKLEGELRNLLTEVPRTTSHAGTRRKTLMAKGAKRQTGEGAQRSGVAAESGRSFRDTESP